jgi:hypothetical protein
MDDQIGLDASDNAILDNEAADDALERLALTGMAFTNYPTNPDAIICVPFGRP